MKERHLKKRIDEELEDNILVRETPKHSEEPHLKMISQKLNFNDL